jgi:hypothetical protein
VWKAFSTCDALPLKRNVGLGGAEVLAYLLGSEPLMEIGRGRVVLAGHKLVEGRLLLRAAAQHQDQVGHGQVGADPAQIVPGVCRRVRIALEGHKLAFVDPIDDPYGGRELLGHRRCSAEQRAGQCTKGERTHHTHSVFLDPSFGEDSETSEKLQFRSRNIDAPALGTLGRLPPRFLSTRPWTAAEVNSKPHRSAIGDLNARRCGWREQAS